MHHWREQFESLGIGDVAEQMVEESPARAGAALEPATAYEDTVAAIEEAEALCGVDMPEEVRAAMLQRAAENDEVRKKRAAGAAYFREAMAEMGVV